MNISQVKIKNFKGISEKEIFFTPGFNLIKGENGRGKTSILEAISVGMGGFITGIPEVSSKNISNEDVRKEYKMIGDGSCTCNSYLPVEIELSASINGLDLSWCRAKSTINSTQSSTQPRDIVKMAEKMAIDEKSELPVLIYEAASRVWAQKKLKTDNPFGKKIIRTMGYVDTLVDASNIKLLENWCIKMEMTSFQLRKDISEYEAAKKAVADFMRTINESDHEYKVFYDTRIQELMFVEGEKILPIKSLSSGYQSLIWMIFDIAYRMAILNPQKGPEITKSNGVILIDEIDMHLHPKWQWNIISALMHVFPNIQFIATTHAPILFASAKNVNIIDVDGKEIEYKTSHYGIDINEAINKFQNTEELSPMIKPLSNKISDSIDEERYDAAEELINKLANVLEDNHPLVTKFKTLLDLETMVWGDEE